MIAKVYADGGVLGASRSEIGGTWAWRHVDEDDLHVDYAYGISRGPTTNNVQEFRALLYCLEALPEGWSGVVCSDSQITLGRFFQGWATQGISEDLLVRRDAVLARLGSLTPVRLDGHPTKDQLKRGVGRRGGPVSRHQVWCDIACNDAKERL